MGKLRTLKATTLKILKWENLSSSYTYTNSLIQQLIKASQNLELKVLLCLSLRGDKSIPSNYMTIMMSHILAKLYEIILRMQIIIWLEIHGQRVKGQVGFHRYHSIMDNLVTLKIIVEESCKIKIITCVASLTLENILTLFLAKICGRS